MNHETLSRGMVELLRDGFPKLYERHVKGRRAAFIAEHAPACGAEIEKKPLGRLPQSLRLLWALAQLVHQEASPNFPPARCRIQDTFGKVRGMEALVLLGFSCVLAHSFWRGTHSYLKGKGMPFDTDQGLVLSPDWSVSLVERADIPKGEATMDQEAFLLAAAQSLGWLNVELASTAAGLLTRRHA